MTAPDKTALLVERLRRRADKWRLNSDKARLTVPLGDIREAVTLLLEQQAEIERLRAALGTSMTALDDWLNDYAHDLCKPERVAEARERIYSLGTIGYIADVQQKNRAALARSAMATEVGK